jgi:molybdopterin synthase sulfur carrier subunit
MDAATPTPRALVRYFAGARAAAGRAEEPVAAATLDSLIADVSARHGERLATVLKASSFLVDGVACHDRRAPLRDGATVDVLPPFAGG